MICEIVLRVKTADYNVCEFILFCIVDWGPLHHELKCFLSIQKLDYK